MKSQGDSSFPTYGHKAVLNKLNSKSKTNCHTWVTLKPTVGRSDFFMLIGRQTRFWSADWSCHIKNIPHRLPSLTTKFSIRPTVARWSADRRPTAFPCRATCWRSADLRATVGRPIIWHFGVRAHATVGRSSPEGRQTVARRWTDHQNPKIVGRSKTKTG